MKGYFKTVLINRAVPGSGKTTFSKCIYDAFRGAGLSIAVHSTDSFFMVGNQYKFDLKNPKVHVNYVWDEKALRLKKTKAPIIDAATKYIGLAMKGGGFRALEWAAGVCAEMPVLPIETRRSLETWRIQNACEGSRVEYLAAVRREEKAFERRIDEVARKSFAGLPEVIERMASKYGYDKAWEIVKALAKDKVAGGTRTQDILNRDLQEFYVQLLTARTEVWNECAVLQQKLDKLRADYAQKVRGVRWNGNLGEIPESLQQQSVEIEDKINALVGAQVSSVVTVAVEAAFAKQGVKCMWRVLGGVAARLGTAAGASLVVSQLDSPLPGPMDLLGAAIFAVGAYGAYSDIKEACVKLPSEMRKAMQDVADGQQREISESAKDECHRLVAAYLSAS
jgi:hypothetical protein